MCMVMKRLVCVIGLLSGAGQAFPQANTFGINPDGRINNGKSILRQVIQAYVDTPLISFDVEVQHVDATGVLRYRYSALHAKNGRVLLRVFEDEKLVQGFRCVLSGEDFEIVERDYLNGTELSYSLTHKQHEKGGWPKLKAVPKCMISMGLRSVVAENSRLIRHFELVSKCMNPDEDERTLLEEEWGSSIPKAVYLGLTGNGEAKYHTFSLSYGSHTDSLRFRGNRLHRWETIQKEARRLREITYRKEVSFELPRFKEKRD